MKSYVWVQELFKGDNNHKEKVEVEEEDPPNECEWVCLLKHQMSFSILNMSLNMSLIRSLSGEIGSWFQTVDKLYILYDWPV